MADLQGKGWELKISDDRDAAEAVTKALDGFERLHGANQERMAIKEVGAHPMGIYAYEDGRLRGGITFYEHNDWVFLLCGYVWPEWRLRGIYRKLIETLAERAKIAGLSGIFVSTYAWEAPWVYDKLGFARGAILNNCPRGNTSVDYYREV